MSGLATFPYDQQKVISGDLLSEAVCCYAQEGKVSETLLFRCIDYLKKDQKEFYPTLCTLLFLRKFAGIQNEQLDHEFGTLIALGKREFFGETYLLQKGYEALVNHLFWGSQTKGFDFKQLEKGGVLSKDHFPHLLENAELGLLACYLGKEWGDEDLLGKGVNLCGFFQLLVNHHGDLFQGVWVREEEYSKKLLETVQLLIQEESTPKSPFLRVMKEALGGEHYIAVKSHRSLMDRSLGFLKYQWKELSLVSSFAGKKTGLASVQKKEISIVSMGPQFDPLADSDCFGIFRPSNGSQEGFKDLTIELSEGKGKIEGWTRMVSPEEGGLSQSWLHFHLMAQEETLQFTVQKSHETANELYFVFFVSADHAQLEEGEAFFPKALKRFEGSSQKIFFQKGESFLEIAPDFEGEMKLIPLAGGTHFWSANFLVAFSLSKKLTPYSWTVT